MGVSDREAEKLETERGFRVKKILVVVDYQKDFVDGALGFEGAELLDERICKKIEEYRGSEVVHTLDTHTENYPNTQEGKLLSTAHCIKGTDGHKNYGKTAEKLAGTRAFEKPGFGSWELGEYLRSGGYDRVELCGLVSYICVITNAIIAKTALPEAEIIVDSRCTSGFDKELHSAALSVMEGLQIKVIR